MEEEARTTCKTPWAHPDADVVGDINRLTKLSGGQCVCGRRLLVVYVCVYCRKEECSCATLTEETS